MATDGLEAKRRMDQSNSVGKVGAIKQGAGFLEILLVLFDADHEGTNAFGMQSAHEMRQGHGATAAPEF
jgi:hypothetical protein